MKIFSRIHYFEPFPDDTCDYNELLDPSVFAADRLPENTSIFQPPTVVPVSNTLTDAERKKLISIAQLLMRENRTRAKLLEACRVWAVLEKENPDEHLYEFMAAADELFQILCVTEKPEEGHPGETHYAGLLPFLDRAAQQNPEVAGYCRCVVWYRLAGIYSASRLSEWNRHLPQDLGNFFENIPHVDDAGNPSPYTRVFVEFSWFTRTYGPQYIPDYLSLVKETSGEFNHYKKFKRIWPSMVLMEKWLRTLVEKDPLAHTAQYGELLALYSGMLWEMRGTESAFFDNTGENSREHAASRDLRFCEGDWKMKASAIRRYRTMEDEVYLIFMGEYLNLDFEGSPARSLSIFGRVRIALLSCIGYHRLDQPTLALLRGWQKSADTLWAAADNISRSANFSEKDYFDVLHLYLHFLDRINDIVELTGNYDESQKYLKRLIVLSRYLWKVEKFYFPLHAAPYFPTWKKYPQFLKNLKMKYNHHANYPGVADCNRELFSIEHPYVSAFGEQYRDLQVIAALNQRAKESQGPMIKTGFYNLRRYEVEPGRYLICSMSRGHGCESWSFFPDPFLHPEPIDCTDLDISPVVRTLDRYRTFMESDS